MSKAWQRVGIIAPGGTVFDIANDAEGQSWIATGAGIFHRHGNAWSPLSRGQPLVQVNALACAGRNLIAGGVGRIVYSTDGGDTWHQSRVRRVTEPITSLVASPAFERDKVVLAGTDGAGVLRSTDSGRNWRHGNFGLQDFSVLALATAPEWSRREIVFAATAHGLYRSPNAGRAWKKSDVGMANAVVLAVAVSPDFTRDNTVFAGTETQGLFRSTDGGKTWHPWGHGFDAQNELPPINCLWLHPEFATTPVILAGTGDGQIFRSQDGGESWRPVVSEEAPVLCLDNLGAHLYAGLHDQGMLLSNDDGQTWVKDKSLAVRAITRLLAGYGNHLLAFGPWEGVWRSADGGETWDRITEMGEEQPVFTLAASPRAERPCLLVGTAGGLLRSGDGGQMWHVVLQAREVTSIAFSPQFANDGQVWVGTGAGELLISSDGGLTWMSLPAPRPGVPLMALAVQRRSPRAETLAAASLDTQKGHLTVWCSTDAGRSWKQWMKEPIGWPSVHLSLAGRDGHRTIVCAGHTCWRFTSRGWQRILDTDIPIVRLLRMPDLAGMIVLTANQVLRSTDGQNWSAFDEGLADQGLVDMALLSPPDGGQLACGLSLGGVVWRRRL